ncbi:MAG: isoleucine--tRNA ligase [Planctomycetota bacterium]
MFEEVSAQFDFPAGEERVLGFWEERRIYERSLGQRRGAPRFVFYEGPPTANGLPHPGHCLTRAIKDLFPRYKTMCGFLCERKGGWDTHGLPVEVEVSKELGIHSKEEIEAYGIEPFVRRCMDSVFRYVREWEEVTRRLGFWINLDEAYVTYHQSYVESVWWALKRLFDAGLLYQGHKIVWWWAQGGTALSAGEVGEGYREVDDPSVYVRCPLIDEDEEGTSLLVWTTTPWTLPANLFVAVHPEVDYVVVETGERGERLIIAEALAGQIAAKLKRELPVAARMKGSALLGRRYRPPFDFFHGALGGSRAPLAGGGEEWIGWRILAADFVTLDTGTGLVHQAPAFGEVDYELLLEERRRFADPEAVPLLCPVAPNGRFTHEVGKRYEGRWVKEADGDLVRDLKERGLLLLQETCRHDYPFCPRAEEDALIQFPRRSWFIRTTRFVEEMLANNARIGWLPEHIRDGRFGKFLESNVDWTLSRERFWATPLPIWVCEESGHREAIAGYEELLSRPGVAGVEAWEEAKKAEPALSEHLKVHRPYIDAITYDSPKAPGARMRRVPDVIDCWFDAGSMPFAQWGYPRRNDDRFLEQFPADFISEALDQTRGWFYNLLAIATLLFGKDGAGRGPGGAPEEVSREWPLPYRNCVVLGLILGEDGLKMSKRKRNYKTPEYIFDHEGADAMRWFFLSSQAPWTSVRFQEKAIAEAQREFLIRLYNVYSFFVIYANIDDWSPGGDLAGTPEDLSRLSELDRWVLSELHSTVRDVRLAMDSYDNYRAARRLSGFVDALSNWYVRRSRDRFWRSGLDADKRAAYETLYHSLVTTALLAAPFVPFLTETIYGNLVGSRKDGGKERFPESVHLCDYPLPNEAFIDETLSAEMALVREIVSLGHAARKAERIRVRQPLSLAEIVIAERAHADWLELHAGLIADELNLKRVELTSEADHYVDYQVKPNFRSIGPRFGARAQGLKKALAELPDPGALRRQMEEEGRACVAVAGEEFELTAEDVQVELVAKEGWAAAQGRAAVVVLKTEITPDLKAEGQAREVVHHVQLARKELKLRYEQRIALHIAGEATLEEIARRFEEVIREETLATTLTVGSLPGVAAKAVEVDGREVRIEVVPE